LAPAAGGNDTIAAVSRSRDGRIPATAAPQWDTARRTAAAGRQLVGFPVTLVVARFSTG
jgi:hypothetical protein